MNTKDFSSVFFLANDLFDSESEDNRVDLYLSDDTILYYGDIFTDSRFVVNY
jgi:hypothetical protein